MKYSRVKADVLRSSKRQSLESLMVGFLKLFPLRLASTQLRLIPQWELSSFILPADHCQEAGGRHRQGLEGTKSTPRSCVEGQREKVWKDTHISEMYLLNRCTASCQSELKVHCYQWSDICQMSYCSQSFYTHFINNYKFRIFAPVICHYFDAHSSRFTILKELLLMLQRWDVCVCPESEVHILDPLEWSMKFTKKTQLQHQWFQWQSLMKVCCRHRGTDIKVISGSICWWCQPSKWRD